MNLYLKGSVCTFMAWALTLSVALAAHGDNSGAAEEFEKRYQAWKASVIAQEPERAYRGAVFTTEQLYGIVELGLPALPFIAEKMEKREWRYDYGLKAAFKLISRRSFQPEDYPNGRWSATDKARMYVHWWKEGRRDTPQRFAKYYGEWKRCMDEQKAKEADEWKERLRRLGVDALPLLIDKIEAGDDEFIPVVAMITRAVMYGYIPSKETVITYEVEEDATREEVLAWWAANKAEWTLPPIEEAVEEGTRESGEAPDGGPEPSGDGSQ